VLGSIGLSLFRIFDIRISDFAWRDRFLKIVPLTVAKVQKMAVRLMFVSGLSVRLVRAPKTAHLTVEGLHLRLELGSFS
jgi:hypothetical protein